jgi:hypothetical protein
MGFWITGATEQQGSFMVRLDEEIGKYIEFHK